MRRIVEMNDFSRRDVYRGSVMYATATRIRRLVQGPQARPHRTATAVAWDGKERRQAKRERRSPRKSPREEATNPRDEGSGAATAHARSPWRSLVSGAAPAVGAGAVAVPVHEAVPAIEVAQAAPVSGVQSEEQHCSLTEQAPRRPRHPPQKNTNSAGPGDELHMRPPQQSTSSRHGSPRQGRQRLSPRRPRMCTGSTPR